MSEILKQYEDYNTSGEFTVWVEKLELVARLQRITDKLAFLPLFLSGPAFSVYQQLSEEVRADYDELKKELIKAFSTNPFTSYDQLRSRVLAEGESVDVYLADLRRLVSLMGQTHSDPLLRCVFVTGLPTEVSVQLRSLADVESLDMPSLVSKARAMLATTRACNSRPVCAGTRKDGKGQRMQCLNCSGFGHLARNCPSDKKGTIRQFRVRKCFICESPGHLAMTCPQRAGNANGGACASDAHPGNSQ